MAKKAAKKVVKRDGKAEKYVSHLGAKDVYPVRIAREVVLLIQELQKLPQFKSFSHGELVEYISVTAFKGGLLCSKADKDRIGEVINEEIRGKVMLF